MSGVVKRYFWLIAIVSAGFAVNSCIEPFSPPELNSPNQYLVVDGFLNMSNDTSKIELRRTQNAGEQTNPIVETGAKIWAENEAGETFQFNEEKSGVYKLAPANFNDSGKYRVNITTADGSEYLSDFVVVSKTPPIDSITYSHDKIQDQVVVKVNTHDPTNSTRFYKWTFEDTYEYYATFYSGLVVQGDEIVSRREDINHCWKSGTSSNIILGSTVKLSKDEIQQLPINIVPVSTNKLYLKYSILVKQVGLTQEAFEYWTSLAKTTQGTGSLFDPQPSQVTGNIKNKSNPKELVFGYFSAAVQTKKRVFIAPRLGTYDRSCELDTIPIACSTPDVECAYNTQQLLVTYYGMAAVIVTEPSCADCRLKGGVNVRPSFWE